MLIYLQSEQGSAGVARRCSTPCQLRWREGRLHLELARVAQRLGAGTIQSSPTHTSGSWCWGDSNSWGLEQLFLLEHLSLSLCGLSMWSLHVVSLAWWPLGSQTSYMMALGSQGRCLKRARAWQKLILPLMTQHQQSLNVTSSSFYSSGISHCRLPHIQRERIDSTLLVVVSKNLREHFKTPQWLCMLKEGTTAIARSSS